MGAVPRGNDYPHELTDEELAEWDEWWTAELEVWVDEMRHNLVNEATLAFRSEDQNIEIPVEIRYEED